MNQNLLKLYQKDFARICNDGIVGCLVEALDNNVLNQNNYQTIFSLLEGYVEPLYKKLALDVNAVNELGTWLYETFPRTYMQLANETLTQKLNENCEYLYDVTRIYAAIEALNISELTDWEAKNFTMVMSDRQAVREFRLKLKAAQPKEFFRLISRELFGAATVHSQFVTPMVFEQRRASWERAKQEVMREHANFKNAYNLKQAMAARLNARSTSVDVPNPTENGELKMELVNLSAVGDNPTNFWAGSKIFLSPNQVNSAPKTSEPASPVQEVLMPQQADRTNLKRPRSDSAEAMETENNSPQDVDALQQRENRRFVDRSQHKPNYSPN